MKKYVDAQTFLSSLRVKELVDKGSIKRDSCSSAVLRGLEHVEKSQYRTQAYKDKQIQLYNTMKVRRHNPGDCLFGDGGVLGFLVVQWLEVSHHHIFCLHVSRIIPLSYDRMCKATPQFPSCASLGGWTVTSEPLQAVTRASA
jgi:hypothetical protein